MKVYKNFIIIVISVICILAFFVFAGVTDAIAIPEIPASFLGAAAGAAITAVVTLLLLEGQTKSEEIKERNVKVFEKKSELFSKYIDILWQVWEDYNIEESEFRDLMKGYYRNLILYMNETSARNIGEQLKVIGEFAGSGVLNKGQRDKVQEAMIVILNTLSNEISLGGSINRKLFIELDEEAEKARSRSTNTSFKLLGIKEGTELILKSDSNVKCWTVDEKNKVKDQNGKELSISALATRELERSANGFAEFMLNGKTLYEMREK